MNIRLSLSAGLVIALFLTGCSSSSMISTDSKNASGSVSSLADSSPSTTIRGEVFQEDASGDVVDGNYKKPRNSLPGVDLIGVRLEATGSDLRVTFTSKDNFPDRLAADQSAVWHITACTPDGKQCCLFGAKLVGSERIAYISEFNPPTNSYLQSPIINGKEMIVVLPSSKFSSVLRQPFKWQAFAEWGGIWEDSVPDEGKETLNPKTIPFPQK